jgi:threonylcarbamoyladenosine tRNA methylthiotransferase CDKAL1
MPSIYIESYGCSASQCEAEIMAGLLEASGFDIIKNEKYADLIIIVTCYVKSPTEQRILFRIKQLKESYRDKKLIIAGCMPEGIYRTVVGIAPEASLVSTHHVKEIAQAVKKTLEGKRVEYLGKSEEVKLCLPKIRKNPMIDIVPISSGCNSSCAYCCVRLAKGKLSSYPKDIIIKEIENSIKQGCKEVWLTSQDNASYGLEDKSNLSELLNEISIIPGNFLVRVGMMNPKNVLPILEDLINSYQKDKIYKFLHLPIQSGDDKILERMSRGYKVEDFLKIVKEFRKNINLNLWTDVIVGFPEETEDQFENTVKVIEEIKPDWTNVSKFGLRHKTAAEKLEQLSRKVVNERSEKISEIVRKISFEKNKECIGWEGLVLISKRGNEAGQWLGRNPAYKLVLVKSKENLLGNFVKVRIKEAGYSHLMGVLT